MTDVPQSADAQQTQAAAAAAPTETAPAPVATPPAAAASAAPAAAAAASAPSASPAPAAAAAGGGDDSESDDVEVREDMTEEELLSAAAPAPKKKRGRPAAAPAAPSTGPPPDALDRLNELLRKTEQFSKFISAPAKDTKGRGRAGRQHERAEEEAEDKELVADELQQESKQTWPDHLDEQPTSVVKDKGMSMRDYQLEALNWLIKLHDQSLNGILADEMGLGKTLMSLSLLAYLKQYRNYAGPHLIIVPKSTSSNWLNEVNRWTNNLTAFKFHGNQEERDAAKPLVATHDITISTYEMVIMEKSFFAKTKWHYIYIDEAHRIKNEQSMLSRVVRTFPSEHRLLITGTPLQNNLHELWALLNFLVPSLFSSADDFSSWFEVESTSGDARGEIVSRLHRLLRPFLLRRLKSEVTTELLPKIETKLFLNLSPMQKQWYKKILERDIEVLNASNTSKVRLLNIVMQLRKVCNHPYLFNGAEPGPPYIEGDHLIENSSKLTLLDKLLKRLKQNDHRVLIFSQMSRVLDILEDFCRYRGYDYNRIDGSTKQDERDEAMETFNAPGSNKFVFLLSTRAGGLGINLQTADTVILFDSDWNPQMDLQAMDRAHRIGQKKQVTVYRLVVEHTIEQKMVERATKKLFLDALVIKQGKLHDADKGASATELQDMVRFGASRIFSGTDHEITDADIDLILARGSELTKSESEKLKQNANSDLLNFSLNDSQTNFQVFEGKDYTGVRAKAGFEFIEPAARSRKTTYDVNAYYRDALRVTDKKGGGKMREWKPVQRSDFQFFNVERLDQLEKKEFESKQRFYALKNAVKAKAREEKRAQEEAEKEARRKARYQARKLRRQQELAAAAAAGAQVDSSKQDEEEDEDDGSDAEEGAAAPASASAVAAAAAPSAAAPAADAAVKMELDDDQAAAADVKTEGEPAAAAAAAAPAAASDAAAAKSEDGSVKMETDAEGAAAADSTADAAVDGRRKSHRGRPAGSKGDAAAASPASSPLPAAAAAAGEGDEDEGDDADAQLDADLMAEAGCLTPDEQSELRRLQSEGFGSWSRRHLISLTKAMEKYGRDDLSNIKVSVEEKTPDEVEKYYYAFWQKGPKMIKEWDRMIKQIERGEQKLAKQKQLQQVIDNKVKRFKNNFEKMAIPYPNTQKTFTEEEDKFLLVSLHRLGYGNWEDLKSAIRTSWMFRFDWFFKSRTCGELSKRVEYLLKILEKEQAEWAAEEAKAKAEAAKRRQKEAAKLAAAAAGVSPSKKKPASASAAAASGKKSDKEKEKDDKGTAKKKASSSHKDKEGKEKSKDKADKKASSHKDKADKGGKDAKSEKKKKDKEKEAKPDKAKATSSSHKDKEKDKDKLKDKEKDKSKSHKSDKSGKEKEKEKEKDKSASVKKSKDKGDDDKKEAGKKRKAEVPSTPSSSKTAKAAGDSEHKAKKHKSSPSADSKAEAKQAEKPKSAPTPSPPAAAAASAAPAPPAAAAPAPASTAAPMQQ